MQYFFWLLLQRTKITVLWALKSYVEIVRKFLGSWSLLVQQTLVYFSNKNVFDYFLSIQKINVYLELWNCLIQRLQVSGGLQHEEIDEDSCYSKSLHVSIE